MINFRAAINKKSAGDLVGIVLTPTDLALVMSGHPIYLDLERIGAPDAKAIGIYFVRDTRELLKMLQGAGLDEVGMEEARVAPEGKQLQQLPEVEEPYFK